MFKKRICKICKKKVKIKNVITRSKKKLLISICKYCDFRFFNHNPHAGLRKNKLDKTRLKSVGLRIPKILEDYNNGLKQSKIYISEYFPKNEFKKKSILEIGCSWGYFLKNIKRKKNVVHGIEINSIRRNFVNRKLKIKCYKSLIDCQNRNLKYDYIFLFYVLEYLYNPVEYLTFLTKMLKVGGKIIIVTPNLNDVLKDVWKIKGYLNFFYDEHAVNYFSIKSIKRLMKKINISNFKVTCKQDYSIINHFNWYLNERPITTNMVGGDYFVENLINKFKNEKNKLNLSNKIINLINKFDANYKNILNKNNLGNQIKLLIRN